MTETWTITSMTKACGGSVSVPWSCQLIHAEVGDDGVTLDLVALEACPGRPETFPAHVPFTLTAGRPDGPPDCSWEGTFRTWTAGADVITLTAGTRPSSVWLCLSAVDQHLILELDGGGN